jgi:hypothetical protein
MERESASRFTGGIQAGDDFVVGVQDLMYQKLNRSDEANQALEQFRQLKRPSSPR